ncbi:MAG: hypothetical protein HQM08_24470 [Candidatus Riflebacteria bacterium]|nr:hypothetical protein [Candidatus Riflebacteria bacterium]
MTQFANPKESITLKNKKPWHCPEIQEMDFDQTEGDFIAVTDGTSFFS